MLRDYGDVWPGPDQASSLSLTMGLTTMIAAVRSPVPGFAGGFRSLGPGSSAGSAVHSGADDSGGFYREDLQNTLSR